MGEDDPSHDLSHIYRVMANANRILLNESADKEVVIAATILHDIISYPKGDPKNKFSIKESAEEAGRILKKQNKFPNQKIDQVKSCILCMSYTFGNSPATIEQKVAVDADLLEATGAISIMRSFSYGGKISRPLYNVVDPFCKKRSPDDLKYSLDLFYTRLLKVADKLHTETAKEIANERSVFLEKFLSQLRFEIRAS